jgi:hypothetical protein
MTDDVQRALEIACVERENFIYEDRSVRCYYMDVGRIIGASDGAETQFVYVEYCKDGAVHGRPMTKDQLRELGVIL